MKKKMAKKFVRTKMAKRANFFVQKNGPIYHKLQSIWAVFIVKIGKFEHMFFSRLINKLTAPLKLPFSSLNFNFVIKFYFVSSLFKSF